MDEEVLHLLQMRLARGEISPEEYAELKSVLAEEVEVVVPPTRPVVQPGESFKPVRAPWDPSARTADPSGPHVGRYMNPHFSLWMWIGGIVLSFILATIAIILLINAGNYVSDDEAVGVAIFFILSGLTAIAGQIFYLIMLFRSWKALQQYGVRTTPGKAVGFLFIPFFNLYWVFIANYGLVVDFNRCARERGRDDLVVPEGIGLMVPILCVMNALPYANCLGWLASLVCIPVYIFMVSRSVDRFVCDT